MKTSTHKGPDLDTAREALFIAQKEMQAKGYDIKRMSIVHGHDCVETHATWMETEGEE